MKIKSLLVAAFLLTCLCAMPGWSAAEDGLKGDVTVGAGAVDLEHPSAKYGEYNGLDSNKAFFVGDADLLYNKGGRYYEFTAEEFGLESRRLHLETGKYGNYSFFVNYREIPHLISTSSRTVFDGAGTNNLTLPAGFGTAATTTAMTITGVRDVTLDLKRKAGTIGFDKDLGGVAELDLDYTREKKEGTKAIGGPVREAGGGPSGAKSTVLPEPVDYTTDRLKAQVDYKKDNYNIGFEYYLSTFDNENDSLTWQNPFYTVAYTNDPQTARISLVPDNQYHRFSLSGGVNLPHTTRVSAVAEYGIMKQDENLLPYTVNPDVTIDTPLPRSTADAEIDTTHIMLNASSRITPRLGVNARYRYYKTENKTPKTLFLRVKNDTGTQTASDEEAANYTLPYDYDQSTVSLDGSYYLFRGTTLKLGYDYADKNIDYREVEETQENTFSAAINSYYLQNFAVGLDYSYARRDIQGTYEASRIYDQMHTASYIATIAAADQFSNHPLMRKFDIADRARTNYGARATYMPTKKSTVGVYYRYAKDDYDNSDLGLQYSKTDSITLDVSFSPAEFATVYAFYTRDKLDTRQVSRSFSNTAQSLDVTRNWTANHADDIDTVGLGTSMGFMEDRLTVSADYTYAASSTNITFVGGSDMPELRTRRHTLDLTGKYRVSANIGVGAGYQYENYESDDWATDGFDPASTTIANVLTLSGPAEDYESHLAMVFVTYYFGADDLYY